MEIGTSKAGATLCVLVTLVAAACRTGHLSTSRPATLEATREWTAALPHARLLLQPLGQSALESTSCALAANDYLRD